MAVENIADNLSSQRMPTKSQSGALRYCPECGWTSIRRSHRRNLLELLAGVLILPYRCLHCDDRFFALRRRSVGWILGIIVLFGPSVQIPAIGNGTMRNIGGLNHSAWARESNRHTKGDVRLHRLPGAAMDSFSPPAPLG